MASSTKDFVKTGKFTVDPSKVLPLTDRLLVRREEAAGESKGGIILPDQSKEKPCKGEVLAVGPGKLTDKGERTAPQVKAGDKVCFGRYAGTVHPDDEMLLFIREDDVLAVL